MNGSATGAKSSNDSGEKPSADPSDDVSTAVARERYLVRSSYCFGHGRFPSGPFSPALSICGFDLEHSLFSRNKRPLFRAVLSTIIFIVLIALMAWRTVQLFAHKAPPFTFAWADSNVVAFMSAYGLGSAYAIGRWTATRTLTKFYEILIRISHKLRNHRLHSLRHYGIATGLSIAFVAVTVAASLTATIQLMQGSAHGNETEYRSFYSETNLFGLEPFVALIIAVASAIATLIFYNLHRIVIVQLEEFNVELEETSRGEGLASSLPSLLPRHSSLLDLSCDLARGCSSFASFATMGSITASFNVIFIVMALKDLSIMSTAVSYLWLMVTSALIYFTLFIMSSLQSKLEKTSRIIVKDKSIAESPEAIQLANLMVSRIERYPTQIVLFGFIPVGKTMGHLIISIAPDLAWIMVILYKAHLLGNH